MTDEKVPNTNDVNAEENMELSKDENVENAELQQNEVGDESADKPVVSDENENKVVNEKDVPEDDAEAAMLAMLEDLPEEESGTKPEDIDFGDEQEVSDAKFQHLSEPSGNTEPRNIDMLMDVNLPVAIELGRTKMSISEILSLGPGSVVELHKLAGEPVDVLVNNKAVARGEVVVIDENFGVRVTQLLTPEERLKAINEQQ